MNSQSATQLTLIHRVKNSQDQVAWCEFVQRYGERIRRWALRHGLQPNDAEDVTQEVLAKLIVAIRLFDPAKGRFRSWLKTVVGTTVIDFVHRRQKGPRATGGDEAWERLATLPARDELAERLQSEFDYELFQIALNQVRERSVPQSWRVFQLRYEQQLPFQEIATQVGVTEAAAKMAYLRTRERIQNEFRRLSEDSTDHPPPYGDLMKCPR